MPKICKFSVLRYVPEQHREEFINIGLVFHSPEDRYVNIKVTSNFSRVKTFNDEVDTNFLKVILNGMRNDFSNASTISGPTESDLSDLKFLEKSTAYYVNQLQFSKVRTILSTDCLHDEENLFKTFVYFDTKKNRRITHDKVKSLLNRVFAENDQEFNYKKDVKVNLDSEDINVDFVFKKSSSNGAKSNVLNSMSFDYADSQEKNALTLAKEWHWNISKMNDLKKHKKLGNSYLNDEAELNFTTIVLGSKRTKPIINAMEILSDVSTIIPVNNESDVLREAQKIVNQSK